MVQMIIVCKLIFLRNSSSVNHWLNDQFKEDPEYN